jgi:hypothetical protein
MGRGSSNKTDFETRNGQKTNREPLLEARPEGNTTCSKCSAEVDSRLQSAHGCWRFACSCGVAGPVRPAKALAQADLRRHDIAESGLPGAPCPGCDATAEIVEMRDRSFGGYALRCLNSGCRRFMESIVYHGVSNTAVDGWAGEIEGESDAKSAISSNA